MKKYKRFYTLIGHLSTVKKEGVNYLPLFLKKRRIDFTTVMNTDSEMHAQLFDEKKEVIVSVPLSVSLNCSDSSDSSLLSVRGYIPFDENTSTIIFTYKGKIINEIQVSKNKPTVKQLGKLPMYVDSSNVELEWETYYKGDSSFLEHKVLYSNNDGKTWQRVGERTKEQKMLIDISTLSGGKKCRFLVQVTDGYNNAYSEIKGFSIKNKPNEVMIVSPIDGQAILSTHSILLNGQAYNYNTDEEITEGFVWSSSIDGELGKGSLLQTHLTKGKHIIYLHIGEAQNSICLNVE